MDDSVIDEKFLARGKIPNEIRVVDGDGGSGSFGIDREDQFVTDSKLAGFTDSPCANGRPLGIEEECDFLATIRRERAEDWRDGPDEVVGCVGHIEAKNLGSAVDELGEGGGVGVFGAKGGDQFCAAGVGELPDRCAGGFRKRHEKRI